MTKRPTKLDKEILEPAMKELYTKHLAKLDDFGEEDEAIDSLIKSYHQDAYDFAKALDYDGWIVDFPLCEALDNGWSILDKHYKQALEQWFINNPIQPYTVGTKVVVTRPYSSVKGKKCIITSFKENTGEYTVREEEKYKQGDSGGYVLNHEDLQIVNG
jgi:hypothetical protein